MIKEIWLPVKNFEGVYEVSSLGRVRSIEHYDRKGRRRSGKVLKPQIACGYLQVYFNIGGKQKWFKVHTLVAEAFLPVPPYLEIIISRGEAGRLEVNHKNEVKTDNRVDNLEWCTSKYNRYWSRKVSERTEEEKREIRRQNYKRYYSRHKEEIKQKNRERYHTKKNSELFI